MSIARVGFSGLSECQSPVVHGFVFGSQGWLKPAPKTEHRVAKTYIRNRFIQPPPASRLDGWLIRRDAISMCPVAEDQMVTHGRYYEEAAPVGEQLLGVAFWGLLDTAEADMG